MTAKRILLLADSPYFGGITSHLFSVLEAFQSSTRHEFRLATFPGRRDDNTLIDVARDRGIPVHTFEMSGRFDLGVLGRFREFLSRECIDLVHAHDYRATLIWRAARVAVPLVNTCHGVKVSPTLRLRLWDALAMRTLRRNSVTISCSDYVKRGLVARGLTADKIRVVHNGTRAPESVSRRAPGSPEAALSVLYVGRLVPGKGLEFLIEAATGVDDMALVLVGDGPERAALEAQAQTAGVTTRFVGKVDDVTPYYAQADVIALPSRMEALPMALIEAAACGKPAVATDRGGIPEVVRDGESGYLVEYGDATSLKSALRRCTDPTTREALGTKAQEIWRAGFTLEKMGAELAKVYDEILT